MCGIAGVVFTNGGAQLVNLEHLTNAMVAKLAHRGPDSVGVLNLPGVSIGACRLAIQDLDMKANQPMKSPDSKCVLVFNGEVFNFIELRQDLLRCGHTFVSSGDTEVVLHAYEQWGTDCLNKLDGMFALALVDQERRRIFLARDRFGIKPLYYARLKSGFVFASEIKALLNQGIVSTELDHHTVVDYLEFGVTDTREATFFSAVKQLPPGSWAIIENNALSIHRWYDTTKQPSGTHYENSMERFRGLLEESIRLRMRSDVPIGILLSGGVDSSAITCIASQQVGHSMMRAFSVGFPGSSLDETPFAVQVAKHAGVQLASERAELSLDGLRECLTDQDEPFISPSVYAQWIVMRAVSQNSVKVLLSGQGADEILCGYRYFDSYALATFLSQRRYSDFLAHLLSDRGARELIRLMVETAFLFLPGPLKRLAWRKRWMRTDHSCPSLRCGYADRLLAARNVRDGLRFHIATRLSELLRYEDRNSMAFSIETRHPFLSHRVVEHVLSLPDDHLVGNGERKRILRLAMDGIVPTAILERKKKIGFQTPPDWISSEAFLGEIRQLLANPPDELRPILDFDKLRRRVNARFGRLPPGDLWRLFNLHFWLAHVVQPIREHELRATGIMPSNLDPNSVPSGPIDVLIPTTLDPARPGSGGGIGTFVDMVTKRAPSEGLRVFTCNFPASAHNPGKESRRIGWLGPELRFALRLRRWLRQGGITNTPGAVVLANAEHYALPFVSEICPIVLVAHGSVTQNLRVRRGGLYSFLYKHLVESHAVRRASFVVTTNSEVTRYYAQTYPSLTSGRLVEIPFGVDLDDFRGRPFSDPYETRGLKRGVPIVLFVGRLVPEKNADLVIASCDLLAEGGTAFQLVVVGDGPLASQIGDAAASRPWLHWIEWLSHTDLLDLMSVSSLLVIASSSEGLPVVLLEALATGIPIVTTDIGRARELVTPEIGFVVRPVASQMEMAISVALSWDRSIVRQACSQITTKIDFGITMSRLAEIIRKARTRPWHE